MWKLKIKRGFTLLDITISLSLFTILITFAFNLHYRNIRQREFNNKMQFSIDCVSIVGDKLLANKSYEQLKDLRRGKPWLINIDKLSLEKFYENDIVNLLEDDVRNEDIYIEINIDGEEVLKIQVGMNIIVNKKKEVIKNEFYKGAYQ